MRTLWISLSLAVAFSCATLTACGPQTERRPEKAAGAAKIGTEKSAPVETYYACPMHPNVRQTTPGTCPECGMSLEIVNPESNAPDSSGGSR